MSAFTRLSLLMVRAIVVVTALIGAYVLQGLPSAHAAINGTLMGLTAVVALGCLLPTRTVTRRRTVLLFLTADIVLIGTLGCLLAAYNGTPDTRLHFIAAFLVANLVAMVGHTYTSGMLGGLAGTMVLGMTTAWASQQGGHAAIELGFTQATLLMAIAFETAFIGRALHGREQQHAMASLVAQQVAARETEAEELSSFMHRLVEVAAPQELVESLLEHLRTHYPIRAHAVAIGAVDSALCVWQEDASLDATEIESRRVRLQASLSRMGSRAEVRNMRFRSLGSARIKTPREPRTFVEIPIQLSGNVLGVLLLADPNPGAIEPHRIGMLTEIARRTAEAFERLERQNARQTRRTTLILREMRDGILLLDEQGQVLIANPSARRALAGVGDGPRRRMLGTMSLDDLARLPPGITRRFRCQIQMPGSDEPRRLTCIAVGVVDDGRRVGTLVTLSDVTDEDRARRRLIQSEKMNLVGQTLAGVAHELNNPLAALMGYADLLRTAKVPEDLQSSITQMRKQALRATKIVKNLLNFARRRNPERVRTNVRDLIEETLELFVYEARIARVTVDVDIAPDLMSVFVDQHAIQQIVVNLVQNALHALEGPHATDDRKLSIAAFNDGDDIKVEVRDNGSGVPEKVRARIFEPFFTTKGTDKGTGLGLALSRSIAREHSGDLSLEPVEEGGTRFVIRLPKASEEALVVGGEQESTRVVIPHQVLVVDDEESICGAVTAQLQRLGAQVDSAHSMEEARTLLESHAYRYDVVLTDLRMPGSTGLELHRAIAMRDPALAERVVFMTGDFVNDELLMAVRRTGNPLLEKPFTEAELTSVLGAASAGPQPAASKPATTKVNVPVFTTTLS